MSRRTKNSMSTLSEADVENFVAELPSTDEDKEQVCPTEMSDHKNEDENHRSETRGETNERKLSEHVVDVAGKDEAEVNRKHSTCEECQNRKDEISEIKAIINEIKTNQNEDREKSVIKAIESDERIKSLHEENSKMTEEIECLKATISELVTDNENIKKILDVKQNEWLKIAENPNPSNCSKTATTPPTTSVQNQFELLNDENCESGISSSELDSNEQTNTYENSQIHEYRSKAQSKFENRKNQTHAQQKEKKNHVHAKKTGSEKQEIKKVLVIGDSMVKHIDRVKIERAAGCQSVVHSYSGARVEQISSKIKEYWSEGEQYDTVLLHVGTNNLASEEPEEVASKMDGLIKDLKDHAKKIAISSVIKRYDNRVPASKITRFNNVVKNLCMKHNTIFLDNDHIDRSLLNRSNLHLNQQGDRVLGNVFCTYLKSFRVGNNRQFFHQAHGHRNREWIMYLKYVNQIMKN